MTRILNREFDLEAARRLHEEGYLPPVARALSARGIRDASELAQDWKSMLPPAMLEGTREAAERLALARVSAENACPSSPTTTATAPPPAPWRSEDSA